jgi:hypothetical protein
MHTKLAVRPATSMNPSALFIAAFFALATSWFAGAQAPATTPAQEAAARRDPKTITIPFIEAKIKVDGVLNEYPWRRAPHLTPFLHYDTSKPARVKTDVQVWYDREALYLGWVCEDADIQATLRARDSKFWEEEVVEFFVTPKALDRYFELQWNPLGGTFDAVIQNKLGRDGRSEKFDGDWSFTATNMTWALEVDGSVQDSSDRDRRWVVEARIPFADLKVRTPKRGEVWRGNFYRFNRDKGMPPELLSWSPVGWPGFHQPARFGYLRFSGD